MPGPLDTLIYGYRKIFRGTTELLQRGSLIFDPAKFTVTDDPINKGTLVSAIETGATPAGAEGDMQINDGAGGLGATSKINADTTTGEVTHTGAPIHRETKAEFRAGDDTAGASFADWNAAKSTNAADLTLISVDVPLSFGDCCVTIQTQCSISAASGRGSMGMTSIWSRTGTTWSLVNERSSGDAGDITLATALRSDHTATTTLVVIGNGIAATNIGWVTSYHIQIASTPA